MPSKVRFAIVRRLLEGAGYVLVRINGSHHIFEKEGAELLSIPVKNGKVKPFYARKIQKIIDDK